MCLQDHEISKNLNEDLIKVFLCTFYVWLSDSIILICCRKIHPWRTKCRRCLSFWVCVLFWYSSIYTYNWNTTIFLFSWRPWRKPPSYSRLLFFCFCCILCGFYFVSSCIVSCPGKNGSWGEVGVLHWRLFFSELLLCFFAWISFGCVMYAASSMAQPVKPEEDAETEAPTQWVRYIE